MVTEMQNYSFVARDAGGALMRGERMAASPQALRAALQSTGLHLVSWTAQPVLAGLATLSPTQLLTAAGWFRPSSRTIEVALRQLAMMLRSGLDLRSALRTLTAQSTSLRLVRSLTGVQQAVERGQSLAGAFQSTEDYPRIVVQLVEVGENSGTLEQVLVQAAEYLEQRRSVINTVRLALAYPSIVATASLVIALYLVIAVIPQLQKFLSAMGRELPAMTRSLLDLSAWLHTVGPSLCVSGIALVMALVVALRWPPARLVWDRLILRLPVVGPIVQLAGTGTLASSLAVMHRSGIALVPSLSIARQIQRNAQLARCVELAEQAVVRGEGLADSLSVQPGPAPLLSSMLGIAEETGQLEATLDEVSQWCQSELQSRVKRLSLWLEPMIIVVAGGIVGYVYMAFFVALMSAGGHFR